MNMHGQRAVLRCLRVLGLSSQIVEVYWNCCNSVLSEKEEGVCLLQLQLLSYAPVDALRIMAAIRDQLEPAPAAYAGGD